MQQKWATVAVPIVGLIAAACGGGDGDPTAAAPSVTGWPAAGTSIVSSPAVSENVALIDGQGPWDSAALADRAWDETGAPLTLQGVRHQRRPVTIEGDPRFRPMPDRRGRHLDRNASARLPLRAAGHRRRSKINHPSQSLGSCCRGTCALPVERTGCADEHASVRPEALRLHDAGELCCRCRARRDRRVELRSCPGFPVAPPRYLRTARVRCPGDGANPPRSAAGQPDHEASDRHGRFDCDGRRGLGRACGVGPRYWRHRGAARRPEAGSSCDPRGCEDDHPSAAGRCGHRGWRRATCAAAAPPSGARLDRRGRATDAASGRACGGRCLHSR